MISSVNGCNMVFQKNEIEVKLYFEDEVFFRELVNIWI